MFLHEILEQKTFEEHVLKYFKDINFDKELQDDIFKERLKIFVENPSNSNFYNVLFATKTLEIKDCCDLMALIAGLKLTKNFNPYNDIIKTRQAPKNGEIISWCEEVLIVSDACSNSCTVHNLDGKIYTNKFYYGFEGQCHYILGADSNILEVDENHIFKKEPSSKDIKEFKDLLDLLKSQQHWLKTE